MKLIDEPDHLDKIDASDGMYPCCLTVVRGAGNSFGSRHSAVYGFIVSGSVQVQSGIGNFDLTEGSFFAFPNLGKVIADHGMAVVIERFGFRGQYAFGLREKRGWLSYIDGCSDSILVYPPRLGDPVLNHLHFPPGILQTQHTHPSVRLGIVAAGAGTAWQRATTTQQGWVKPLRPGAVFLLEEQELHSFRTDDQSMDVIAFHPDSDWGPTDSGHPMIQRTYIDHGK